MAPEPVDVWAMADLVTPFAVRTAATLRLADIVQDGELPLDEIAKRSGAEADPLGRVLRYLVRRGLFTEPEPEVFGPNEASRALQADAPGGSREWLDLDGAVGRADLAFVELVEQVRGHHAAYPAAFGRSFREDLAHDPQLSDSFDDLMETKSDELAPAIAAAVPWERFGRVTDVGGGKGVLLAELLERHPDLLGTLVDLAGPAGTAEGYLESRGVRDRAEVVVGDFFDPLPPGADAYVLCDVLGDWEDADAVRLLGRCAEAAGADGREGSVLIIELLPDQDGEFTEMDLRLMVYVGGRMRDLDRTERIVGAAGLFIASVTRLDDGHGVIECLPDR
ncbi:MULTISPECIES: methyltransferase [unclassified Saccharopolyspora]|uniref:methyltransferase n=1 Tax=unclassified Saccharopolyspora TaxID=2646250 RepID=UPI001CD40AF8|nr:MULTISPECIES: methyltransferase [unclassified Saccharopolyspora]MCA1194653.1 SAM-dependent methyltransferase [Saccharopolyspora sp. 6V]MCA1228441.1 SAM-dependent methyltransferase [Saccharopolyspora sp. 6M]